MKKSLLIVTLLTASLQNAAAFDFKFLSKEKNRDYIYIVGSSTISPLMAAVSEEFSRVKSEGNFSITTPVVESTGTRNGFKVFCKGIGYKYPDFVNASRPISKEEIDECAKNNVKDIIEIKIGYDGIAFGNFIKAPKFKLTKEYIFLALAQKVLDKKTGKLVDNFYETWNQIDAKLPKTKIVIYGPPLTSGTRDVFMDMLADNICMPRKEFVEAYKDEVSRKNQCHKIRNDGKFIESGENDSLMVGHLKNDPTAIGILGFNFVTTNNKIIKAVEIDGVLPSFKSISSKAYPFSRPLLVYFKKENIDSVPEIRGFIAEIINQETIGSQGYLIHSGLVPLSQDELVTVQQKTFSKLVQKN